MGNAVGRVVDIAGRHVRIESKIAEGGYSHVFLVSDTRSGELFALKRMIAMDRDILNEIRDEIKTMKILKHSNIIRMIGAEIEKRRDGSAEVGILMEYAEGGHMVDIMNQRLMNRFTEQEILRIVYDVCLAVAFMHEQDPPMAHRDLKVENVLLSKDGIYKICDFGSVTTVRNDLSNFAHIQAAEVEIERKTTPLYRPPEMVDLYAKKPLTEAVDIWAIGCMAYKLAYYKMPFEEYPMSIINNRLSFPDTPAYSKSFKDFIKSLLNPDPLERPDIWQTMETLCRVRVCPYPLKRLPNSNSSVAIDDLIGKKKQDPEKKNASKSSKSVSNASSSQSSNQPLSRDEVWKHITEGDSSVFSQNSDTAKRRNASPQKRKPKTVPSWRDGFDDFFVEDDDKSSSSTRSLDNSRAPKIVISDDEDDFDVDALRGGSDLRVQVDAISDDNDQGSDDEKSSTFSDGFRVSENPSRSSNSSAFDDDWGDFTGVSSPLSSVPDNDPTPKENHNSIESKDSPLSRSSFDEFVDDFGEFRSHDPVPSNGSGKSIETNVVSASSTSSASISTSSSVPSSTIPVKSKSRKGQTSTTSSPSVSVSSSARTRSTPKPEIPPAKASVSTVSSAKKPQNASIPRSSSGPIARGSFGSFNPDAESSEEDEEPSGSSRKVSQNASAGSKSSGRDDVPPPQAKESEGFFARVGKFISKGIDKLGYLSDLATCAFSSEKASWVVKATSRRVMPPKQKYVSKLVVEVWNRKEINFLLDYLQSKRPLLTNPIVALKALVLLHRIVQEGPPEVARSAFVCRQLIEEIRYNWQQKLEDGEETEYSLLIVQYASYVLQRFRFLKDNDQFEGNFSLILNLKRLYPSIDFGPKAVPSVELNRDLNLGRAPFSLETAETLVGFLESVQSISSDIIDQIQHTSRNPSSNARDTFSGPIACKSSILLPLVRDAICALGSLLFCLRRLNEALSPDLVDDVNALYLTRYDFIVKLVEESNQIPSISPFIQDLPDLPITAPDVSYSVENTRAKSKGSTQNSPFIPMPESYALPGEAIAQSPSSLNRSHGGFGSFRDTDTSVTKEAEEPLDDQESNEENSSDEYESPISPVQGGFSAGSKARSPEEQARLLAILEKILDRPENQVCADCPVRAPTWASINIGCFICPPCSGIHRHLGTHISQVKSVKLDFWSPQQVEFMKKKGNAIVNGLYETRLPPSFEKPGPDDMEALQKFITDKYEKRMFFKLKKRPDGQSIKKHDHHSHSLDLSSSSDRPQSIDARTDSKKNRAVFDLLEEPNSSGLLHRVRSADIPEKVRTFSVDEDPFAMGFSSSKTTSSKASIDELIAHGQGQTSKTGSSAPDFDDFF